MIWRNLPDFCRLEYLFTGKIRTCGYGGPCGSITGGYPALPGMWPGHGGAEELGQLRQVPGRQESQTRTEGQPARDQRVRELLEAILRFMARRQGT